MDLKEYLEQGLTSKQVTEKQQQFGLNVLHEKPESTWFDILIDQFKSPLVYLLLGAGLISAFIGSPRDTIAIFLVVVITALIGFWQEWRAQKAFAALSQLLTSQVKTIRGGKEILLDVRQLVPGDIVRLPMGTRIPADGLILEASDLTVNESILTGESQPIVKKKSSQVYAGSTTTTGLAKMIITNTGNRTRIGKIGISIFSITKEKTPLQQQIFNVVNLISFGVLGVSVFVFIVGLLRGFEILEILQYAIALAVAAIPEGLLITLTVALVIGMKRISRHKSILRKLLATEVLGTVNTICVDKTGTLTEGVMRVVDNVSPDQSLLLKAAILCNDMRDPLEIGMMSWALRQAQGKQNILDKYPRLDSIPFDFKTKLIATLHPDWVLVSGAPEILLNKCRLSSQDKKTWLQKFQNYSQKGNRLVGFAYKNKKSNTNSKILSSDFCNLDWLGILVYEDPVRIGVKQALAQCQAAGINIKVITGDYPQTAKAVVDQLGLRAPFVDRKIFPSHLKDILADGVIEGSELAEISQKELVQIVDGIILFARINPEQKLKIVQALKEKGQVVAMMGDGVNDAPALAQADIGIVVNDASDVAKETAEMVLLDSNFQTIYLAAREGRNIYENVRKGVTYLLTHNFSEILLLSAAVLVGLPLPLFTAQILWINLYEDLVPNLALTTEKPSPDLMKIKPHLRNEPLLDRAGVIFSFVAGIITFLAVFGLYYWLIKNAFSLHFARTMVFALIYLNTPVYIYSCRSLRKSLFAQHPFDNHYLNFTILFSFVLLGATLYIPALQQLLSTRALSFPALLILVLIAFWELILIELFKIIFIIRDERR